MIYYFFAFSGQFPKGILRFGVVLLANKTESYFDEEEKETTTNKNIKKHNIFSVFFSLLYIYLLFQNTKSSFERIHHVFQS